MAGGRSDMAVLALEGDAYLCISAEAAHEKNEPRLSLCLVKSE